MTETTVSPEQSPFTLDPIIQKAVTPDEVLAMLREEVGTLYMPSSTSRRQYNIGPYFEEGVNDLIKGTQENRWGSGFYKEARGTSSITAEQPVWAFLCLGEVDVVCNLFTSELYVRRGYLVEAPWLPFDRPVHFDRHLLREVLDEHF